VKKAYILVPVIIFIFTHVASSADLIANARLSFDRLDSYRVTLRSSGNASSETIQYSFKKPGHIRMEFIRPHSGTVLVYNPMTNKVRVRPFGFLKFLVFTIDPDSRLLRSSRGHTVDRSDIGSLLETVSALQLQGIQEVRGEKTVGARKAVLVSVKGGKNVAVNGVHSYALWLDTHSHLPLRVTAYNSGGEPVEDVIMDDLQVNVEFPEDFFDL